MNTKIVGIGQTGVNIINNLILSGISGVDFITIDGDPAAVDVSIASNKILLNTKVPLRHFDIIEENNSKVLRDLTRLVNEDLHELFSNDDFVIIIAGMGGVTGSRLAPAVAAVARERAASLIIGFLTLPFKIEGWRKIRTAEAGLQLFKREANTTITLSNERLIRLIDRKTLLKDIFKPGNKIMCQGIMALLGMMLEKYRFINVEFSDIKSILFEGGQALLGIGKGSGENCVLEAAKRAIDGPFLIGNLWNANGILINAAGGQDLSLNQIEETVSYIYETIGEVNVVSNAFIDTNFKDDEAMVTIIATMYD